MTKLVTKSNTFAAAAAADFLLFVPRHYSIIMIEMKFEFSFSSSVWLLLLLLLSHIDYSIVLIYIESLVDNQS